MHYPFHLLGPMPSHIAFLLRPVVAVRAPSAIAEPNQAAGQPPYRTVSATGAAMREAGWVLLALCLAASIASGCAVEHSHCWSENECTLRKEANKACASFTSKTACTTSAHCEWQTAGSFAEMHHADVSPEELATVSWPAAFNLSAVERACGDVSRNETCPATCRDHLTKLGSSVVTEAAAAVCQLSTCDADGVCWETDSQAAFKEMFVTIASSCIGNDFPSCWPNGGRCVVTNVCEGLDESMCGNATLTEGGAKVCNYTSTYRCSDPHSPSPYNPHDTSDVDSCRYSQDPCCRRADSFSTCVLDSPPEDSCNYYSSGCQPDYNLCSRQVDHNSCSAMADSGCFWVTTSSNGNGMWHSSPMPDYHSNSTRSPSHPWPYPHALAPGPSRPYTPGAAPWQIWHVPEFPPGYFSNETYRWWNDPERSGHGLFDVLTPPIADALLHAGAPRPLCLALTDLLQTMSNNTHSVCELSGLCSPTYLPELLNLTDLMLEKFGMLLEPCTTCGDLVEDFLPMFINETGIDLAGLLLAVGPSGIEAFGAACPTMLEGVLWIGKHFDFLLTISHPMAAALCPVVKSVVAESQHLMNNTRQPCALLGQPEDCFLNTTEPFMRSDPASAAASVCYAKLPHLFEHGEFDEYPQPVHYNETYYNPDGGYYNDTYYNPDAVYHNATHYYPESQHYYDSHRYNSSAAPGPAPGPSSGYCMMSGYPQCMAPDSASCSTLSGCRWSASCQRQQCSENDHWCLQRSAALPACGPLVRQLVAPGGDGDAPIPLAQVCQSMGMCTGTSDSSPACSTCLTAMSETVASIKYQRKYNNGYGCSSNIEDSAFSQCSSTMSRLNAVKARCNAFSTLNASALAASAAATCQELAESLCQSDEGYGAGNSTSLDCGFCTTLLSAYKDLATAGVLQGASGLSQLCFETSQYGGSSADNLRQQLRWRYGCNPSDSCCAQLPPDSYLSTALEIGGLTPQSTSSCEELPGCTASSYCWPSWGADTCQSLSSASACKANQQCQWFAWGSDGEQGNCVDAALSAKCRLAGQQGGKTACLNIRDDQGMAQCSHFQSCHMDWALRPCDDSNACCLKPADLFQPEAPIECANKTTQSALCDYSTQCQSRYDPCNAFMSSNTCELSSSCSWRTFKPVGGYPAYGWCTSTRDSCWEFSNDHEACASAPNCRSVPRCDVSYCPRDDECCLIKSPTQCSSTPGCASSGWCSLVSSDCWQAWDSETCTGLAGCRWQSYNSTNVDGSTYSGGWCSVADDPCASQGNSPIGCAAVRDPRRGTPLCRYQTSCYDACRTCRECLQGVSGFISDVLPSLNGDTSRYAQAVRDFCVQSGGDYWTCWHAFKTVAAQPEAATRPAAMCKAIGQCSTQCMGSMGLVLCSSDGTTDGAITAPTLPDGTCKSSATCTNAQSCDTSSCQVLTQCDVQTGFDVKSCGGTCVSKCSLLEPLLARLNKGTCDNDGDCTGAGESCMAIEGRTCKKSACNDATGAITTVSCTGFCASGGAPSLVSAALSNDGRQITITFDQDVTTVGSSAASAFFAPSTVGKLGGYSQVFSSENPKTLVAYLGWGATIVPDEAITLAASPQVASRINGQRVTGSATVLLQEPQTPEAPVALLSGPTSVGAGCAGGSAADVILSAARTPFSAGRAVTYSWDFLTAASQRAELDLLAVAATNANDKQLVLPGATVAGLSAGEYTVRLTVENWLGGNATADFVFTKSAAVLPMIAIVGGSAQEFSVASGIRVQTAIDLSTVCPGRSVSYSWAETSGLLPAGAFTANRPSLSIRGPVAGVTGGSVLNFSLSATLEGAGSSSASLSLTARQSAVMAVLAGPRGDVLDTRTLTFSGSGSLDPDDAANTLTPFRYSWDCTATDPATQISTACFPDPLTAPDMTASQLVIAAGLLPAGDTLYTITLTAAKGSGASLRTNTDTTTLRVLSGAAPTGRISRFCPGFGGCPSKLHTPSEPLRLVFTLDDTSLLPRTTFSWTSSGVSLATATSTARQALVIQPFTPAGTAVFTDGAVITVNITAQADGKNATATISVPIARRPTCTATNGACLSVSPTTGPVDTTTFTATASAFAADSTLTYDFGRQLPGGRSDYFIRSSGLNTYTFAPRVLAEGTHTLFVCARDITGAQACSTANVTATPAAQQVTASDINDIGDNLTTAVASGSTDAVVSVARQLSAATSSGSDEEAQQAATEQAENAMGAMEDILSGDGATVEDSQGVASAASTLVASTPEVTPEMADSAMNVANSALDTLSAAGPVDAADMNSLLDIAGACANALVNTSSGAASAESGRRRLLDAQEDPKVAAQALAALTRTFHVVSGVQTALLRNMVEGESQSVGTGELLAAVGLADLALLTTAEQFAIGDSGAAVTLMEGFAALVDSEDTTLELMLSYLADPSLLFAVVSSSAAESPAARRKLLLNVAAPEVLGAVSTTVVSGYVNFTSSLDGMGTVSGEAIDITLPLNNAYDAGQSTMCLRLDSSGYWRSDAIQLTSVSGSAAHCALSNLNNQQVVVVQYVEPEGGLPETPSSPSPSPSSNTTLVTLTVPQIFFTARLTAYDPETFTNTVQQLYIAALQAAVPSVSTLVLLTNIRSGSVVVDTTIRVLVRNNNTAAADSLASTLSTNPASVLLAAAWGEVTVSGLVQSMVEVTVDDELLSWPPKTKSNTTALIAGIVGGVGGAILVAGIAIAIWKCRAARAQVGCKYNSNEAEMMESQPSSPMSPVSPTSPTPFIQKAHQHPFAPSAPIA